ncbi:MAG: adenine nucleotide alpha hydrolase family protein [Chloroflexi bacterium]|nr:adenine nucleotide alpha hydrolase family protein [Chloroflexota bacterium]
MRCRKCNSSAVINMRHHKLALCGEHYGEWFVDSTQRAIEKYKMFDRDARILVAVSGGKDSLALWDVLTRLGYTSDGLYIGLGIQGDIAYSDQSLARIREFQEKVVPAATLHVVDIQETYGKTIPQIARENTRGHGKPCAACGLTKRYVMNRLAAERGYTVLATGHNLDDEAAVLMQNTLHWQTGYLARQAPVLEASDGLARKVKPFCRFYERETATYALVRGIDYVYDECPHAVGNLTNFYKTLLNQLENESPGAKLQFYIQFLKARAEGFFQAPADKTELHACEVCGQPTTAPGRCAFCRMWNITSAQSAVISADAIPVRGQDEFDDVEARVAESVDVSGL